MGMSSSQARLLNLTSRMHQLEYNAQKLEAQKLQMANESAHVYNTYLNAVDKTKVQFGNLTASGELNYTDATLSALENGLLADYNGVTSSKYFLLQNAETNEIYVTSQLAEFYGLSDYREELPDLETFLIAEGCTKTTPIYSIVPDYTNVISATPIANQKLSDYTTIPVHDTYNLSNTLKSPELIDIAEVITYTSSGVVPTVTSIAPSSKIGGDSFLQPITTITEEEAVTMGYSIISTADDLANMVSGNNYILMDNIDLSEVDWIPLDLSNISLNGNGFEIRNANNTIFNTLTGCTVENLGINGSEITSGTYYVALAKETAGTTDITNCYIINTTLNPNRTDSPGWYTAGLVGVNNGTLTMSDCYVDAVSNAHYGTAGFVGDNSSNGSISIVDSVCDIAHSYPITNFVGYSPNNVTVTNSYMQTTPSTTYTANGYSLPGTLTVSSDSDMERYLAVSMGIDNYDDNLNKIQGKYNVYQLAELVEDFSKYKTNLINNVDLTSQLTKYNATDYILNQDTTDKYNVTTNITPESHTANLASKNDILLQLASDLADAETDPSTLTSTLAGYFTNDKMYSNLNYYYSNDKNTYNQIINNIKANNLTNVMLLLNGEDKYSGYTKNFATTNAISVETIHHDDNEIKGQVNIPTLDGIASNLVVALRKAGYTIDEADIKAKLSAKLGASNDSNNITLANINEVLVAYLSGDASKLSNVQNIYNHINNGASLNIPAVYDSSKYVANRTINGTCSVEYGTKNGSIIGYDWDKNKTYYNALAKYEAQKIFIDSKNKYIIVDDELANSNEFLNNMLIENSFVLLSLEQGMNEENMKPTNISVETCLQQVSDETDLKKAEAKYEADMRKINAKDKKFDIDIAALEQERNAIKTEMDTLKTVAKDNVDRTFKLFS